MTVDRAPARLADLLGFVREQCVVVAQTSRRAFVADRIATLAVEKLFVELGVAPA